uniref:Helicase-associated domain-containing protein n=1 Tax=Chaetoceros debilis TaxID=122233 RepID=A0A7S3V7X2_9STRA
MNKYMLEADKVGSEVAMNRTRHRPKSCGGTVGQSRSFDESSIASTPGSISLQSQGLLKFNGGKSITSTSTASPSADTMLAANNSNQENGMSLKYDVMYQALHGLLTGEPDVTDIKRGIGLSQTDSWDADDGKQKALHFDAGTHDSDKHALGTATKNRCSSRRAPEKKDPCIKKRKQKEAVIDYSQRFRPSKRLQTNKDAKCSPSGASVEKSLVTSCQQEVAFSSTGTQASPYEAKVTKTSSNRSDESSEEELPSFDAAREKSPPPPPKTFEERLEGIKEYKRTFGHCNIPESYGSESDPTLGKWCTDVRSTYTAFETRSVLPKGLVPIRKSLNVQKLRSLRNAGFQLSAGIKRNGVVKRYSRPPPSLAEVMVMAKDYPCLSTAASAATGRPGKTSTSTKTNRSLPFDDGMKESLSFKGQNGNFGGPSYCENIQQSGTDQHLSHRCSASQIGYDEYSKDPPPPLGQMEERLRHLQDAGFPLDEIMAMKEAQTKKIVQFNNETNSKASSNRTQQAQNINFYNSRIGAGYERHFVGTMAQHESDGFVKDSTGRSIPVISPAPTRTAMQVAPPEEETFSVLATNHDANSYCSTFSPVSNSTPLERLALQRPNEKEAPMLMVAGAGAGSGAGYNMPLPTNQNLQSSNNTAQSNAIASAICTNSSLSVQTQLNHSTFAQSNEMKLREKSSVDPALAKLYNDIRSSFTTFQSTAGIPTGLTETRVKCLEDAVMQLFSGVQEQGSNQTNKIIPSQTMTTARPLPKAKTFDECANDLLIFKAKFGHCNVPFDYLDLGIWVNDIRLAFKELEKLPGLPETMIATRLKRLQDIGFIFDLCEYAHNKDAKKKLLSAINVRDGVILQTPMAFEEIAHNSPTFPRVESNTASKVSAAAIRDANILLQSATKMRNVAVNNSTKINDRFISTPPLIYKEPLHDAKKLRNEYGTVDTCAKASEVFIHPLRGCESRLNCTKQKPVDEPTKASGSSSTRSNRTFEEYLNDINIFKSKYGHCDIPENYLENPSLGRWCQDLKSKYEAFQKGTTGLHKDLSFSRIKSLEDAGFQFSAESNVVNPTEVTDKSAATLPAKKKSDTHSSTTSGKREYKTFDQRIDDLIEFKKKTGHCNVPYAHVAYKKDPSLGSWCCDIRSAYKAMKKGKARRNALTESKIKRLEEIKFKFHLDKRATRTKKPPKPKVGTATLTTRGTLRKRRIKRSFDQRVEDLKDFKKIHGHCNVPYSHAPDPSLGTWCSEMRKGYKVIKADSEGRRNGLNVDKIKRLEDIGFQWCIRAVKDFEERVKELLNHKDKRGHCNVSKKENPSLYEWCHNKRVGYVAFLKGSGRCHALTENRVKRLNEIGFNWMISQTVSRATTQSKSKTSKDHILCMKQTKSKLFEDLITANSKAFEEKIDDLNALKSKFGHCNVPKGYSNDPVLDKWCMDIRSGYRIVMKDTKGSEHVLDGLASQRIQLLKDIGFRLIV